MRIKGTFSFIETFSSLLCYFYSLCSPYISLSFLASNRSLEKESDEFLDIQFHLSIGFPSKKDEDTSSLVDNGLPAFLEDTGLRASYPSPELTLCFSTDSISRSLLSSIRHGSRKAEITKEYV